MAIALALGATAVGPPANDRQPARAPAVAVGVAGHPIPAVDAAVVPAAAAHATGITHAPRPLPVADVAPVVAAVLVVVLSIVGARSASRERRARASLPPPRGPPYRLASR